MSRVASLVALLLAPALAGAQPARAAADSHWVATWGTAQQQYMRPAAPPAGQPNAPAVPPAAPGTLLPPRAGDPARRFGIPQGIAPLRRQTVRMIARASIGGRTVRVRLSNAIGAPAVAVGAAHLALRDTGSAIRPATDRALTFGGRPTATLYAGQTLVSDPVSLDVPPLADLAVSVYAAGDSVPVTSHLFGLRPTYVSAEGDQTARASIGETVAVSQSYYWLAGIDVLAPADALALVTFGDSITDGDQSTPDTNGSWPARLAARLQLARGTAATRTPGVGVVNAGISGNRLMANDDGGLARLVRDAIAVPGVRWITLLEGINDLTGARPERLPTFADELIAAYRQVIATAHEHGLRVAGCTLTPFGGSRVYSEERERVRRAVNEWVRTSGAFDAVIDFDAAVRDPRDPTRIRTEADSPDGLHPGDAGYRLMAEAVDLTIFTSSPTQRRTP